MIDREQELIVDLAKLLRKYGPEPFESLAALLEAPGTTAKLAELLRSVSRAARKTGFEHGREVRKEDDLDRLLGSIKTDHIEKFELLQPLANELRSKSLLPSLGDVRHVAESLGISTIGKESRPRLVGRLLSCLSQLSLDELRNKVRWLHEHGEGQSGLAGWAGLIMRETPK